MKRVTYGEAAGMRTGCRSRRRLEGLGQRRCFQEGTENLGSSTREGLKSRGHGQAPCQMRAASQPVRAKAHLWSLSLLNLALQREVIEHSYLPSHPAVTPVLAPTIQPGASLREWLLLLFKRRRQQPLRVEGRVCTSWWSAVEV